MRLNDGEPGFGSDGVCDIKVDPCGGQSEPRASSEGLPWPVSERLCRNPLADARGSDWRIPRRSGSLDWPALVQGFSFYVAHPAALPACSDAPGGDCCHDL